MEKVKQTIIFNLRFSARSQPPSGGEKLESLFVDRKGRDAWIVVRDSGIGKAVDGILSKNL